MDLARFTKLRSFMGSTRSAYELKVSLNTAALCEDGARCAIFDAIIAGRGYEEGKIAGLFAIG